MRGIASLVVVSLMLVAVGCSKPLADAQVIKNIHYFSDDYAAQPNDVYYALRFALEQNGFPMNAENMQDGVFTTAWLPVTSDSHYIPLFNRKEYSVTNSFFQLDIRVVPMDGRTQVDVGTRVKSLVDKLKSSGVIERQVLADIGNFLRKGEPTITNLGVSE